MKKLTKCLAAAAILGAGLFAATVMTSADAVALPANYFAMSGAPTAVAVAADEGVRLTDFEPTLRTRPLKCRGFR